VSFYDENGNLVSGSPVSTTGSADTSSGSDASSWLSGLGDLFAGVGSGIAAGFKATSSPKANIPSGWVYNPANGNYYNPATGQALTSTGTLTSVPGLLGNLTGGNSFVFLILIGVLVYLFVRHRG
jgi:hypothetical protein